MDFTIGSEQIEEAFLWNWRSFEIDHDLTGGESVHVFHPGSAFY